MSNTGCPPAKLVVYPRLIIGRGYNKRVQEGSVIKHGEMDCLENAGRLTADVYRNSTLYTTLSPCEMCSGTILLYKIPRVVIGENINFLGNEALLRQRGIEVIVLDHEKTKKMMGLFISQNPSLWFEDIGTSAKVKPLVSMG